MKLNFWVAIVFLSLSASAQAQGDVSPKKIVIYDPLFWKQKLKLNDNQCRRIRQINSRFYQNLNTVAHEEHNVTQKQRKAQESLEKRSEEIWQTFDPKQRKRWKKIWSAGLYSENKHES